ncbi:MAG: hypothetical protein GY861_25830 [bacterium]|nr:hypothetical protein [bacterium]
MKTFLQIFSPLPDSDAIAAYNVAYVMYHVLFGDWISLISSTVVFSADVQVVVKVDLIVTIVVVVL